MAYYNIEKRPRADGIPRYRCTVGVKSGGKYIYRENRTFGKQSHAKNMGHYSFQAGFPSIPKPELIFCSPQMTLAHLFHR
ncbi:hypothetical protein SAMN05421579_10369 [Xenorhabdus japonica]|uniref:Integrase n=1 Tax=Xenorhabdus japonica TaxID=53341 RepID=A0A1I4YV29_9GAMM|nr:hypothetical protein SAMN05421579_10369 [Xenorhabdus japonica]